MNWEKGSICWFLLLVNWIFLFILSSYILAGQWCVCCVLCMLEGWVVVDVGRLFLDDLVCNCMSSSLSITSSTLEGWALAAATASLSSPISTLVFLAFWAQVQLGYGGKFCLLVLWSGYRWIGDADSASKRVLEHGKEWWIVMMGIE